MFTQSKGLTFNRQSALDSIHQSFEHGDYIADFFSNAKVEPIVYHYIITRRGSNQILDWGQGFSMESMQQEARKWMKRYLERIAS